MGEFREIRRIRVFAVAREQMRVTNLRPTMSVNRDLGGLTRKGGPHSPDSCPFVVYPCRPFILSW